MNFFSTILTIISNIKNIKSYLKNFDKLIIIVIIVILGSISYFYIKHEFNKKDEIIQQKKIEINNLKVMNEQLKQEKINQKFENEQVIKKVKLKEEINTIDIKNNHLVPDETIKTDNNKTIKKINIKTIRDTTKINELQKNKEYIIEIQ